MIYNVKMTRKLWLYIKGGGGGEISMLFKNKLVHFSVFMLQYVDVISSKLTLEL